MTATSSPGRHRRRHLIHAAGTWTAGQLVTLAGFTNGLPTARLHRRRPAAPAPSPSTTAASPTSRRPVPSSPSSAGAVGPVAGGGTVVIPGTNLGGRLGGRLRLDRGHVVRRQLGHADHRGRTRRLGRTGRHHRDHAATPAATSTVTPSTDTYSYVAAPTVTGLTTHRANPAGGPTGGGTQVTIAGTSFDGVTAVDLRLDGGHLVPRQLAHLDHRRRPGRHRHRGRHGDGRRSDLSAGRPTRTPTTRRWPSSNGTASYSNSPGHRRPRDGHEPDRLDRDHHAIGAWAAGQKVGLSGLHQRPDRRHLHRRRRGAPASFTITYAPALTARAPAPSLMLATVTPVGGHRDQPSGGTVTISAGGLLVRRPAGLPDRVHQRPDHRRLHGHRRHDRQLHRHRRHRHLPAIRDAATPSPTRRRASTPPRWSPAVAPSPRA